MLKLTAIALLGALSSARLNSPHLRALTDAADEAKIVQGNFAWECESSAQYLSNDYLLSNPEFFKAVCDQIREGEVYRIEFGSTLTKDSTGCHVSNTFTQIPTKVLCAETAVANRTFIEYNATCPANYALISAKDIDSDLNLCEFLASGEIVRYDSGLTYQAHDVPGSKETVCYKRYQPDVPLLEAVCVIPTLKKLVVKSPDNEKACGEGMSLVTAAEAYANKQLYCSKLKVGQIVRLAGGAHMMKDVDDSCPINIYYGTVALKEGFCAPKGRSINLTTK